MARTQQDYLKHLVILILAIWHYKKYECSIAPVQVIWKMYTSYVTMHDIFGRVSLADTDKPEIQIV